MSNSGNQKDDGLIRVAEGPTGLARWAMVGAFTLFAIIIVGTPIYDGFFSKPRAKLSGAEKIADDKKRATSRWSNGSKTALIASDLRESSEVRRLALPFWAGALWFAFGDVAPALVSGDDGWIFVRSRSATIKLPDEKLIGLAAASVACADRRLSSQGIEPYMLLLPRKEAIAAKFLPTYIKARPELDVQLIRRARALGSRVADLDTRWWTVPAESVYHQSDSHWNDGGAFLAAESMAELMGISGAASRSAAFQQFPMRYSTGDAYRMSALTRVDRSNPLDISEPDFHMRPAPKSNVPFKDRNPPPMTSVALTGTSFAAHSRLRPFLEAILGTPIWSGALPGLGPISPVVDIISRRPGGALPKTLIWEIPIHYLVCGGVPLDQLAGLVTATAATNVSPIARIGDQSGITSPKSTLLPGDYKLSGELMARPTFGRVIHPGNGMLAYRIRGQCAADLRIATASEGSRITATWPKGTPEIVVPVIAWHESSEFTVYLRGPAGTAVKIDSIELVTDCQVDEVEMTSPWTPSRLDHVVVNVAASNAKPCGFTVTATCADGATIQFGATTQAHPGSRHFLSVAQLAGKSIVKLEVVSDNPKALVTVKRAPWIAPVVATESRPK